VRDDSISSENLPLPFSEEKLLSHDEDAIWVFERLRNYAEIEEYKIAFLRRGAQEDELKRLARLLARPAFPPHIAQVLGELSEVFVRAGSPRAALLLLEGAMAGPHPDELLAKIGELFTTVVNSMQTPLTGTDP
jgi:hypothetical protein